MGFFDPSGSLGRHFGSLGMALDELSTCVTLCQADQLSAEGANAQRAVESVRSMSQALQLPDTVRLSISEAIPEHVGLGSGTQMALAIGLGLSTLYGLNKSVREIAALSDRGARSGIGIAAFEQGGFVVDGGRTKQSMTPPLIARMEVPDDWRFILVFDARGEGIHGAQEREAFKKLPPFPEQRSAKLCHQVLMQTLPALAEHDLASFGASINQLQNSVGDYFAEVQGGRFTSGDVGCAVRWLGEQGATAIGQSSWGPTGFCAIEGVEQATQLLDAVIEQFSNHPSLTFSMASGRNRGGTIDTFPLRTD